MRVHHRAEIEKAVDPAAAIDAIAEGFAAFSKGIVIVPPVGHLEFKNPPGEMHIKYGYRLDDDVFVVKDDSGDLSRIQVKTATARRQRNGYSARFKVAFNQLRTPRTPDLIYVFAVRGLSGWEPFVIIGRDALLKEHPNFRLAHLVRGDLLLARARPLQTFGNVVKTVPQERVEGLREEALARLRAARQRPGEDRLPRYVLQLHPEQKHALVVDSRRSRLYVYANDGGKPKLIADYYVTLGKGPPLLIVHGGPGASHDYFLPYLLPLARHNRVIFIDERGSGRSQKLADPSGYTVENMVEDVEAVRQALGLGKITLLGHSYGGVVAQAYALKYQRNLSHLVLASTFSSTRAMNEVFRKQKQKMPAELRERIDKLEAAGLYGKGPDYRKGRYPDDYMVAAWGEGYFPYLYQNRPDANYDPVANGIMSWDLYREMWGEHGEFVIDGNLKSVEYTERLAAIKVPTLVMAGDHDECDPSLSQVMHEKIAGSKLVVLPKSGHMTFVDQPELFVKTVDEFLRGGH